MSQNGMEGAPRNPRVELHESNVNRLRTLMGGAYDDMEMRDYLSYISPEDAKTAVDLLEEKSNGETADAELIRKFKGHLEFLCA